MCVCVCVLKSYSEPGRIFPNPRPPVGTSRRCLPAPSAKRTDTKRVPAVTGTPNVRGRAGDGEGGGEGRGDTLHVWCCTLECQQWRTRGRRCVCVCVCVCRVLCLFSSFPPPPLGMAGHAPTCRGGRREPRRDPWCGLSPSGRNSCVAPWNTTPTRFPTSPSVSNFHTHGNMVANTRKWWLYSSSAQACASCLAVLCQGVAISEVLQQSMASKSGGGYLFASLCPFVVPSWFRSILLHAWVSGVPSGVPVCTTRVTAQRH